jgi:hypothetical protein
MTDPRHDLRHAGGARDPLGSYFEPAGATATRTPPGGTPVQPPPAPRRGRRRWVWLVAALVAVAALLFGLSRYGAEGIGAEGIGADGNPAAPAAPAGPGAATPGGAPAAAAPGSLTAGTDRTGGAVSLFAAAAPGGRGLPSLLGQTATGRAVRVQSVPADEGFWIGTGETERVWVQLTSDDESPVAIAEGALLDLSGPVVGHGADFARKAGVTAQEGAEQLTRQAAHLEVDPSKVTVVGTR